MAPLFHVEALLPSSISPKIDSILHSHIYPQVGHVFRAVAKFKALLVDVILNKKKRTAAAGRSAAAGGYGRSTKRSGGKKRASKIAGLVKMQFTASSSPAGARRQLDYATSREYSAPWSAAATEVEEAVQVCDDATECGYLCWLEEEERPAGEEGAVQDDGDDGDVAVNEIDRLAEKFIARFHAKFLLEKQESYRRYQEMIARSI
ncbi:uncharacterized protein [Lolium perenne]|uniref:uncharacterized protein n=1 Tax=Lolium perenne TaxID=4522 RepID=UPI0021F6917F|nr:uncharacterized protein LOC127336723 [Lolium perenne]